MKGNVLLVLFAVLATFLISGNAVADELWLQNGDRITGKVVSLKEGVLVYKTSYAGKLSIQWEEVAKLETDEPVKVILGDEMAAKGIVTAGKRGKLILKTEKVAEPLTMELADVKSINPGPSHKMNLRINFGLNISDGNTDSQNIYGDGEFLTRTDKHRYTIGALYRRSEEESIETEDRKLGYMKYDYFFSKKWYGYSNATAEEDEFRDLDLKASLGIGAGYQFVESDRTSLSLEGGLSYVDENHIVAEDDNYAAGRWGLRFDHDILPESLQYFLYHTGLQSVEDSEDLSLYTQTGFRIPFYKNMNLSAQFNWDYDKDPPPGIEKNDYLYMLTLGYQWADF